MASLLFATLLLHLSAIAQYNLPQNKVWAFGDKAGLDFNQGSPVAIKTNMEILEGCASISGDNGRLLFYTNGTKVWDRNHIVMPNGDSLNGDPNRYSTNSTTQAALIVPLLNDPDEYYLFSLSDANDAPHYSRLAYSIIDMHLNNGLGDVVPGKKAIVLDSMLSEKLIAIPGDHCNIWVVVHAYQSNLFKAYEITDAGINPNPVFSTAGGIYPPDYYYGGVMKGSPDRKLIVSCTYGGSGATGRAELFHFDPASGQVSNFVVLDGNAFNSYYGAAFSPDNTKLYITGQSPFIYQYDLSSGNGTTILNSQTDITQNAPVAGLRQGDLKLGPDGKIYVAEFNQSSIGVIESPNQAGVACNYTPRQIQLLSQTQCDFGLPNDVIGLSKPVSNTTLTSICFFKDSIPFVIDSTAWDITWDDGTDDNVRYVSNGGVYSVSYYTVPCTYHTDTFILQTPTLAPITGFSFSGCKGVQDGMIWVNPSSADSVVYTYTWLDSMGNTLKASTHASGGDTLFHLGAGSYTLHLKGNHCDTVFRFDLPAPDYQVSYVADTLACAMDTLNFLNSSSNSFILWWWDFGDGTFSNDKDPIHVYSSAGRYPVRLMAQTTQGCYDTATHFIEVDARVDGHFLVSKKQICTGESITFTPRIGSSSGLTKLLWDFGDGTYLQTADETIQHAYDRSGMMQAQLTAQFRACPDVEALDTIQVYPLPVVDIGPDTSLCLNENPLLLSNRTIQPGNYFNLWNTGDTSAGITVRSPGIYRLKVTSDHDCVTTGLIHVSKDCYIDIPNAFTPNGDGINDYFFPRQLLSGKITKFSMKIFNRWGALIFETSKTDGRGWDGKVNDLPQPSGVYVYIITAEINHLHAERYQGNITLIR